MAKNEVKNSVESDKKDISARINRIVGQMNGVKRMFEEGKPNEEIVVQLSAIDKSIKSVANLMIQKHLKDEFLDDAKGNVDEAAKKVIYFFKMFQ